MPRYFRVLDLPSSTLLPVSDCLAEWKSIETLFSEMASPLAIETPSGAVDGANAEFVFAGTPLVVMRDGVEQAAESYTITDTHTVTFDTPPPSGLITGVVLKAEQWKLSY